MSSLDGSLSQTLGMIPIIPVVIPYQDDKKIHTFTHYIHTSTYMSIIYVTILPGIYMFFI
jgi:hypothetical protein